MKEADIPEYSDEPSNEHEELKCSRWTLSDEDDVPKRFHVHSGKSFQIKSEREVQTSIDRESKRQKTVSLQEQNRKARLRKVKEAEAKADEVSEEEKGWRTRCNFRDLPFAWKYFQKPQSSKSK